MTDADVQKEIEDLYAEWMTAATVHDDDWYKSNLADEFYYFSAGGGKATREEMIDIANECFDEMVRNAENKESIVKPAILTCSEADAKPADAHAKPKPKADDVVPNTVMFDDQGAPIGLEVLMLQLHLMKKVK